MLSFAAENQISIMKLFLSMDTQGVIQLSNQDRWGSTALDDAVRSGHQEIAQLLKQAMDTR